jgi:outer membrane usher protein
VAIVVDGVEVASDGPVLLELAQGGSSPLAPSAPVVAALSARLRADAKARLLAVVHDHYLSIDALRAIGLRATYDPHRLELQIDVPADMTQAISHDFGAGGPPDTTGALAPSELSGVVNLHAGGGGTRSSTGGSTPQPFHLNSDAAVNVLDWVLEARGDLASQPGLDTGVIVHRGDTLLTRDMPQHAVRFLAGDFAVPSAGLQASYPLLGIGAVRNFALQPYKVLRPVGSFDFVLDRPSTITVLVNGAVFQTLSLPAGRHDVRDLPLGAGVSNVELLIKDDVGVVRRIAFSAASPDALLAPGITQFSLDLGFPLLSDVGLRSYDYAHPVASGRYRAGVTSMLTLGGSFDGSLKQQVGGAALAVATSLGNLSADASASREDATVTGFAMGARYDYGQTSQGNASTLAVAAHRYSPGFRGVGPQIASALYSSDASIAVTGKLAAQLIGRLDMRYQVGRDVRDAQYVAVGAFHSFGEVGIDASISALRDEHTRNDVRLFVTAHWMLRGRNGSIHAASRASSATGVTNEATYNQHSATPVGALATSFRLSETSTQVGAGGTAEYSGYRFTTSLGVATTLDREGRDAQSATLEAATALAFAGGRLAWSRPIAGSFAMIDRNPALDGIHIGVNPVAGGYAAETDGFGPGVLPNLEPYRISRMSVEAPGVPLGSSLGPASYVLLPTYRSGTLVRVGEDGTVFVRGIMLHYNGESVAFAVASVLSLDDGRRAPAVLMTNRAGRFSVSGLRPGRYAVRLAGDTVSSAEFEIPAGTAGVYSTRIVEVK